MDVIWAILCQHSSIDKDTNNISLFSVIEELNIVAQPPNTREEGPDDSRTLPLERMELVILWKRSDEDVPEQGDGRVRIITPDGQEFISSAGSVDLTRYLRLRSRIGLNGIPFRGTEIPFGDYHLLVQGRTGDGAWAEMFDRPLRVGEAVQESD